MSTEVRKARKVKAVHGVPVQQFSMEHLLSDEGLAAYVWPHEGEWDGGCFIFHNDYVDFEPLLVDAMTRNLLKQVYEKLREDLRPKFKEKLERNRGMFVKMVDACWQFAKVG